MNELQILEAYLPASRIESLCNLVALLAAAPGGGATWPSGPAERLRLVARALCASVFGREPVRLPLTRLQQFMLRKDAIEWLARCVNAFLLEELDALQAPPAERAELETLERAVWARHGITRAGLRKEAFGGFLEHVRGKLLRGELEIRDAGGLRGYLRGYLFRPKARYRAVLLGHLGVQRHPTEELDPDGVSDAPPSALAEKILPELRVLDAILLQADDRPHTVLREWRTFLHGILRDAAEEQDRLCWPCPAEWILWDDAPPDSDQAALRARYLPSFLDEWRRVRAEVEHDGPEPLHLAKLQRIRGEFEKGFDWDLAKRDFLAWLYVWLLDGRAELTATEQEELRQAAQDWKNNVLKRAVFAGLKSKARREGTHAELTDEELRERFKAEYFFIYGSLFPRS